MRMDPQTYSKMYFSLNFRWPLLMGNGCNTNSMQPPVSSAHSAFKALPPSCANSLPPISSLRGDIEPGTAGVTMSPSHHHNPAASQNSFQDARVSRAHPQSMSTAIAQQPEMKNVMCAMGTSMSLPAGMGLHTASHSAHPAPHPAFPMPISSLVQPPPEAMGPLHHLMSGNKALALTHYLTDPLAKAALMDLGRYGQYPLGKKLFGCPQCRYVTDRKNNLKRHVATMHQECDKVLECCGVVFKNKASLRDHVLIFHSNGYMCRFCGRNFCRKALLKRHLTVHSGQKDYVCSLCDYATSHKSNLERHKKVHERQGSDQDDLDSQHERHGLDFPSSHANCTMSCTPGFGGHLGHTRAYQSGHSALYDKTSLSARLSAAEGTASNSHDQHFQQVTSHARHHGIQHVTSASSSSGPSNSSLGVPKRDGGLDLNMCHPDIGSYSVERILNSCKVPHVSVTIPDMDDLEDDDTRDLLDDNDDEEDTHSSGLIDVVHVDLQE